MSPITHFMVGWLTANAADLNKRERVAVTIAGIIPDVDGLGIIAEKLTVGTDRPLLWWTEYHHVIGHNLGFCLLVAGCVFAVSEKRWKAAGLAGLAFHLHLIGDVIGARGPDGFQWPIPYLLPFHDGLQISWSGQWALDAWPNFVITGLALVSILYLAWKRGFSPLEIVSESADRAFVATLRNRFGDVGYGCERDLQKNK